MYRIDNFYRYVWNNLENRYTLWITEEHGNRYLWHVAIQNYDNSIKKGIVKALKILFKWRHHVKDDPEWECM